MLTMTRHPRFKRIVHIFDGLFSLGSIMVVGFLLVLGMVWCIQPAPSEMVQAHGTTLIAKPGDILDVASGLGMKINSNVALYKFWIINSEGKVVYLYSTKISGKGDNFMLNHEIKLPDDLPKGNYVAKAELTYPFNPFKDGKIEFQLATISII